MRRFPGLGADADQRVQALELQLNAALERLLTAETELAAAQADLVTQAGQIETLQTDLDTLEEVVAELG